ncbi:MAG: putative DNA binding domain-containing protein [Bacteroidales bacterium]|nr:putative DNA binding domain-containing protein [Bacteroidales bacterium]MCF8455687.1 putative DNA binding domain-containing protein [Bacteroidales bacterium]
MTIEEIKNIIGKGEDQKTEFKKCQKQLPNSFFETVCAFLNTIGGKLLLGISDNGEITGVDKNEITKLKKEIADLSNNKEKLDPVFMLTSQEFEIDNKQIIVIDVPESSMVHKTNGSVFMRNEDGDYKISQLEKIAEIVNRKKNYYSEQTVYPKVRLSDFNVKLIERAKHLIGLNNSNHPWIELDNEEFLFRAGFYKESDNGKNGYTLAAILFFGTDHLIQSIVPAYKFEALLRKDNVDRYDDRLTIRTNLLDAYDLLMGFVEKHINDPFFLEGTQRISIRSKIFRELVANIIAHREYLHGSPAVINIFKDKIEFSNPNNPRVFGTIDPKNFTPYAKNPTISKFMLQLGIVEEVGSGMKNVFKYLPGFAKDGFAEFIDKEFFTTVVYLKPTVEPVKKDREATKKKIIELIEGNNKITTKELAENIGISEKGVEWQISRLKSAGTLRRIGSDKGGHWDVSENKASEAK